MKQLTLWTEPEAPRPRTARPARHGCALVWAKTRLRCPECGGLVDWRPGREGRVWMRGHYRTDVARLVYCIETFTPPQRDLSALGVELEAVATGCQALAGVSQRMKRVRGM